MTKVLGEGALLTIAVAAVMVAGLFGTLVPLVPGLPLIWAAALFYAYGTEWDGTAWTGMGVITFLLVAGTIAKIVLPSRRVSESGAPRSTLYLGAVGGVIGFFVVPVVGLPLGAVAGVLLAEYRRTADWGRAWTSTKAAVVGFGIGTLIEIGAGVAMIGAWAVWVVVGN